MQKAVAVKKSNERHSAEKNAEWHLMAPKGDSSRLPGATPCLTDRFVLADDTPARALDPYRQYCRQPKQ